MSKSSITSSAYHSHRERFTVPLSPTLYQKKLKPTIFISRTSLEQYCFRYFYVNLFIHKYTGMLIRPAEILTWSPRQNSSSRFSSELNIAWFITLYNFSLCFLLLWSSLHTLCIPHEPLQSLVCLLRSEQFIRPIALERGKKRFEKNRTIATAIAPLWATSAGSCAGDKHNKQSQYLTV